jgi:UDP-3-O-[3-hydroxymyristoyl] glucosamine N-acyltransferase
MTQFGGLVIEDNVQIGANTTIERGAIDNTIISRGCKLDNSSFVSHNNFLGENVFMVGESMTFGSVTVGRNTQISGNAIVRNGLSVGDNTLVGAGAIVMRNVGDNKVVMGNPAKEIYFPGMKK